MLNRIVIAVAVKLAVGIGSLAAWDLAQAADHTKESIQEWAVGKTKEQVRTSLGKPSSVFDMSYDGYEAWVYWSKDLRVTDPDTGGPVKDTWLEFSTRTGTVQRVHF